MSSSWVPSSMEQTCLRQLDRPESWTILKCDRPEETDSITWRHVRRIFGFNAIVFAVIFGALLCIIAHGSGYDGSEFREDLPVGLASTLLISTAMAIYAANLYRKSWNRRAKFLRSQEDEA